MSEQCEKLFTDLLVYYLSHLKQALCSSPVLRSPNYSRPYILQIEASDRKVGAVLSQIRVEGEKHPIAYFSQKLLPQEEQYSNVEKDCLAIKLAVYAFCMYLLGCECVIQTDHYVFEWLDQLKEDNSRLCR